MKYNDGCMYLGVGIDLLSKTKHKGSLFEKILIDLIQRNFTSKYFQLPPGFSRLGIAPELVWCIHQDFGRGTAALPFYNSNRSSLAPAQYFTRIVQLLIGAFRWCFKEKLVMF